MKIIPFIFAVSSLSAADRFIETLYPAWGQSFESTKMIHAEKSDFWDIAIFENPIFGRVLAIDGTIQTTEKDEYVYHEMLVHPALLSLEKPTSVLIIGGGDGGTLREVLRHKDVERVVMVEIDRKVMDLSKEFLPTLSNGAFEDPRAEIIIQDAAVFVRETEEKFDAVLCDCCDPIGACGVLFSEEFYGNCKRVLKEGGIFVNQNGVPFLQKEEFLMTLKNRKPHFKNVSYLFAPVPTYTGGFLAFGWASDYKYRMSLSILKKRLAKVTGEMKYYTPEIHKAAFARPAFLESNAKCH